MYISERHAFDYILHLVYVTEWSSWHIQKESNDNRSRKHLKTREVSSWMLKQYHEGPFCLHLLMFGCKKHPSEIQHKLRMSESNTHDVLMKFLPFSFSTFRSVHLSDCLWFSPVAAVLPLCSKAFAPKLWEKRNTKEECGVRYRRSPQHPFPLNFPSPPPQVCGLNQLGTKTNIPLDWHEHRTFSQKLYCKHPICFNVWNKIWWDSVCLSHLFRLERQLPRDKQNHAI